MIKYMQYEEYESKVRVFHRERVERFHFNFSLVNQVHREGEYIHDKCVPSHRQSVFGAPCHVTLAGLTTFFLFSLYFLFAFRFANIEIKSVKFENSLFENCYFEDIKSTNTFFENCTIKNTIFYNTGEMKEEQ